MALELRRTRRRTRAALGTAEAGVAGEAIATWAVTRFALIVMAVFTAVLAGYVAGRAISPFWSWDQWDTHWYLLISRAGYREPATANFFPLYPSLVGAVAAAAGDAGGPVWPARDAVRLAAALLVSAIASAAAFAGLALAAEREAGPGAARPALLALAAYPFAFFLSAGYSDACFMALAVFALLLARSGAWKGAALCAVLAGLARPTAVALVFPLALEAWRTRRSWPLTLLAAALPLLGGAAFAVMLWLRFGDPLLAAHTQQAIWHHRLMPPWATASLVWQHLRPGRGGLLPMDLGLLLTAAALLWAGRRRLPAAYTAYAAGLLVLMLAAPIPTQNDVLASSGRYLLAAFPIFIVLGGLMRDRPWLQVGVAAGGFMLQAGLLMTFLLGGPVL